MRARTQISVTRGWFAEAEIAKKSLTKKKKKNHLTDSLVGHGTNRLLSQRDPVPRVWPRPKGWGKYPVLQLLAQMLLAEAVGVGLPCQGTIPYLRGTTGTCQEIQPSR